MKTKKKCEICSKRFEAVRSDAKYCSGACKQKGFILRKITVSQKQVSETVFYLDEYQNVCNRCGYDSEIFPFIFFCFLRKNLNQNADIESVTSFINSTWTFNNYQQLVESNAYIAFQERFLEGSFNILSKSE